MRAVTYMSTFPSPLVSAWLTEVSRGFTPRSDHLSICHKSAEPSQDRIDPHCKLKAPLSHSQTPRGRSAEHGAQQLLLYI